MRSMLVSAAFLLAVIATVSANAYYVEKNLGGVLSILEEVPENISVVEENPEEVRTKCGEALGAWQGCLTFLSLSVDRVELRECTRAMEYLYSLTETGETADFIAALREARLRLELLRSREGLHLINIV